MCKIILYDTKIVYDNLLICLAMLHNIVCAVLCVVIYSTGSVYIYICIDISFLLRDSGRSISKHSDV
jgi:hypothetical protein